MPVNPTYSVGTVSVSAGGSIVTGVGTLWLAGEVRAGDIFERAGLTSTISSVESNTSLTLARPWPGTAVSESAYEIRYTPDANRVLASARQVVELLDGGNLPALSDLPSAGNTLPYFIGPGAAALTPISSVGRDILAQTTPQAVREALGLAGYAGAGIRIQGVVSTVGALPATGNTIGDAYLVGTSPANLYVWGGTAPWANAGPVSGSAGLDGVQIYQTRAGAASGVPSLAADVNNILVRNGTGFEVRQRTFSAADSDPLFTTGDGWGVSIRLDASHIFKPVSSIAGTADAITGVFPPSTANLAGTRISISPIAVNTGPASFNGVSLRDMNGSVLTAGALIPGRIYMFERMATIGAWQMVSEPFGRADAIALVNASVGGISDSVAAETAAREAAIAPLRDIYREVNTVAGITPVVIDVPAGVVTVWEEGGVQYGPGLGGSGGGGGGADMAEVRAYAEPRQSPLGSNLPIITGGRDLWLYRNVMGQLVNGSASVKPRIMMTGDSWVGMNLLATALRERIAQDHAIGGAGHWPAVSAPRFGPGGYSRNGSWQEMDITVTASAVPAPMPYGMGLDGHLLTTAGTDATCVFTNVQASEFTIYSINQGGTWGYVLNGAPRVVVNDSSDGNLKITRLTMNSAGGNSLTIDTTGNTGRVSIRSYGLTLPGPGVEVWQAGNGGSMGLHWSLIAPNIPAIAADIQPHVCVVVLGTNDYRYVAGTTSYIQGLRDIRDAYRLAVPDIGFLFVAPARSAGIPLVTPQVQLRDALYEFCISEGHEFYNMYDDWPDYATANARGMWADTAHPTLEGYRAPAARIYNQFLKV